MVGGLAGGGLTGVVVGVVDGSAVAEDGALTNTTPHYSGGLTCAELHGVLQMAGAYQFIEYITCDKVAQPALYIGKTKICPKMIPLACTHGANDNAQMKCRRCGTHCLEIVSALRLSQAASELVEVMI